jgi:hypothetical protein
MIGPSWLLWGLVLYICNVAVYSPEATMQQLCSRCYHPFGTMRRRLHPICTICLLLPDPLPDFPPRWPYHGDSEPAWLRRFLEPRLFDEQEPAMLRPAPAVKPELRCRDCGAPMPRRLGSGLQKRRCEACRAPAPRPAPPPEELTFHRGRSCIDCDTLLPDPVRRGKPPTPCPTCREHPRRPIPEVKEQPPVIPDYKDLADWLQPSRMRAP